MIHTHRPGDSYAHAVSTGRYRARGVMLPSAERTDLYVRDGRVTFEPVDDATDLPAGWIVPGLVDAHCHVGLDAHGAVSRETARAQAVADRDSGVLLVRDAGSPSDTRWMADQRDVPRVIRAGRHIARPKRYIRGYAVEIDQDELVGEVRRQARRGDGWVKLVGDWIDRGTGDLAPLWPADVAARAIEAAHIEGARVTAHCFDEVSVAQLVRAGIDCIEHGTGLDDDTIALMADRGVSLVPTLINIATFPQIASRADGKFPRYAAHMRALHASRYETIGKAIDAGVPVWCGTDAGGTIAHGRVVDEICELVRLGGAEFAVGAASWRAREWLGCPGLVEGAPADFVIAGADPRRHPEALRSLACVMLNGRVISVTPSSASQ